MTKILFKEEQKYRQPWVWFIIVPLATFGILFFMNGFHKQIIRGEPFGEHPLPDEGLLIVGLGSIIIIFLVSWVFYKTKMVLTITKDYIFVRYPPILSKEKMIRKDEIERYDIREYKPIREFGGWGIRTGNKKNGKAYSVSGNTGLQLYLKNGTKILFGTKRKEAIGTAMQKMMASREQGKISLK